MRLFRKERPQSLWVTCPSHFSIWTWLIWLAVDYFFIPNAKPFYSSKRVISDSKELRLTSTTLFDPNSTFIISVWLTPDYFTPTPDGITGQLSTSRDEEDITVSVRVNQPPVVNSSSCFMINHLSFAVRLMHNQPPVMNSLTYPSSTRERKFSDEVTRAHRIDAYSRPRLPKVCT